MSSPKLRIGRASMPGHYYAVTLIVDGRRRLFSDSRLARCLATELAPDALGIRFKPLAWTIMPDHAHLLVELGETSLSRCMQILKSRTSRELGRLRRCPGRLWQQGFYDHCLRGDEDLLNQARYILNNPVRGALVERPGDYPFNWSIWGKEP